MKSPAKLDPERIWKCAYCGMPRYYLTKPCLTCERLARRYYLHGRTDE